MTHFTVIHALLWWSGTEAMISSWYVCLSTSLNFSFMNHWIIHPKHSTLKTTDLIHPSCILSSMWKPTCHCQQNRLPCPTVFPQHHPQCLLQASATRRFLEPSPPTCTSLQSSSPGWTLESIELTVVDCLPGCSDSWYTIGRWGLFEHFWKPRGVWGLCIIPLAPTNTPLWVTILQCTHIHLRWHGSLQITSFSVSLYCLLRASRVAQWWRTHLPIQETQYRSLGWEDPLEKEMATHSSILAWEIPGTEEPSGLQSMGSQRVRHGSENEQQLFSELQKHKSPPRDNKRGFCFWECLAESQQIYPVSKPKCPRALY